MDQDEYLQQRSLEGKQLHSHDSILRERKGITNDEKKSIITLTLLYFIQGIPLGFFGGTLQILLIEAGATFEELAIFSVVTMPFSFKILTAPLLESFYSRQVGKRRTYILPTQYFLALLFLFMGFSNVDEWVSNKEVNLLTLLGTFSIFLAAQQDIAVDGWVLTSLSEEYVHLGASCQSIGQILGNVFAQNVLISLNSTSFCNSFIFSQPQEIPLLTLSGFCTLTALIIFIITLYVHIFTKEKQQFEPSQNIKQKDQMKHSLNNMMIMLKNRYVLILVLYLISYRLGVQPMYASFTTKLQQKGFPKETLTNVSTLTIPIAIAIPIIVGAKIKQGQEFTLLFKLYAIRFIDVALQYVIISTFDLLGGYNYLTAIISIFSMFVNFCIVNITFVIHSGFFNKVSDSDVGGTYLTFLASSHNLGVSVIHAGSLALIGWMGFDTVIILSYIYSIIYYLAFKNSIMQLQSVDKSDWKVKKIN